MTTQKRERRDWTLLIFIIPIGILLILFVGQLAVRMSPFWRLNTNMNSNLEPEPGAARPFALLDPILPQILTPFSWFDTYLTPGADVYYPPFLTFEPTATPSPTEATATATESSPTPVPITDTPAPTSTPVVTGTSITSEPTDEEPPKETSTPTATTSPTTPPPSVTSTIDPALSLTAVPSEIGIGSTPDNTDPGNPNNIGNITDGTYIVISLVSLGGIVVEPTPDNNYDLAIYEFNNNGSVYLDSIIIGITNAMDGSWYYEVFNWGDGTPDMNSNVGDVVPEESDKQIKVADNTEVPVLPPENQLYDPDHDPGPPAETNGPAPQTGILIDVDTADSHPPPDTYDYIVIISPSLSPGGPAQVDAVQTVEVPTPTP